MLTLGLLLALVLPPGPGGASARWYAGSQIAAHTRPRLVGERPAVGGLVGGAGVDEMVATKAGGPQADYCNAAKLGGPLDAPGGSSCRAHGGTWSETLRGVPLTRYCSGYDLAGQPMAPCNLHHFVSNAADGLADRPWDTARFGPFPSLVVETDVAARRARVITGGWGFVCPLFVEVSDVPARTVAVEFCIEEWSAGSLFPTLPFGFDTAPAQPAQWSADGHAYALYQVVTAVQPGRAFASMRPGSDTTWTTASGGGRSRHLAFAISSAEMQAALHAINATWQPGLSEDPGDYAYAGIEQGVEGGGVVELRSRASHLAVSTVTDALYAGQTMRPGESLRSRNGAYALVLRGDGNLVVYDGTGTVRWATNTAGNPGDALTLEPDGNLVLMSLDGRALWSSGTASTDANLLVLGNGGRAVLYAGTEARWATSKVRSPSAVPTSTVSPSR